MKHYNSTVVFRQHPNKTGRIWADQQGAADTRIWAPDPRKVEILDPGTVLDMPAVP